MAVVYQFYEAIMPSFPIKYPKSETLWGQDSFATGFNVTEFTATGLENVLRSIFATTNPSFKSGVDDDVRNAGKYQ